ncbi:hypothetical protein ACQPZF_10390 [Actinosynnema sp. CS-041913]|uniref:OmpA family protein n=1 Tax=Actinosynnema sp. CS-041913 TaxID=3239917 RepID=UPI003D8DE0EB
MGTVRTDLIAEPVGVAVRVTRAAAAPPAVLTTHTAAQLQRVVGNAAVGMLVAAGAQRTVPVQRCGQVPPEECGCHDDDVKPAPAVQRAVQVHDPTATPPGAPAGTTNATIIDGYVRSLCSDFKVSGTQVEPVSGACRAPLAGGTPLSCDCLCTMHQLATPLGAPITWTIVVDDSDWPHTDPTSRTVTVPSGFSAVEYGYWNRSSRRSMYQNWRVLAHEMCGHARLFAAGTHPTGPPSGHGGRPSHDPIVMIENAISAEHGIPAAELRGLFADPHHGESIARIIFAEFPNNSTRVSALPPAESAKLRVATAFMRKAGVEADVIGHSDQSGSAAVNNRVSRSRAENIKANLIGRSVRAGQFIAVRGVGSTECPAPGPQPSCRRVELIMFVLRGGSLTHP